MSKNQKGSDAKRSKEARGAAATDPSAGAASVDQIRDIIFGNQMRDYDKRFARMEERLMIELGSMRDETVSRLDAMERFTKKEIESLGERITAEQQNRSEIAKKSSRELAATVKRFSKEIAQMVDRQSKDVTQLRAQILDQSKALLDEIHRQQKEAAAKSDSGFEKLRNDKLDRSMLAELLTEVAVRVSDELAGKLPEE